MKSVLICFFGVLLLPISVLGQSLERISITERSDSVRYVVRFHFTEPVDSFKIAQPEINQVQMILYSDHLITSGFTPPVDRSVIDSINIFVQNSETGFELALHEEQSFIAESYLDVNLRDVLLSLRYADPSEVDSHIATFHSLFKVYEEEVVEQAEFDKKDQSIDQNTELESSSNNVRNLLSKENSSALDRITPGDPMELYLRAIYPKSEMKSRSSFLLRPANVDAHITEAFNAVHPWMDHPYFDRRRQTEGPFDWSIYTPVVFTSNNSAMPMGQNDGVLWQGKGNNYFVTGGAGVQFGPLTAVFRPQFAYSENLKFSVENTDPSTNPSFDVSDYPRFADSEFQMHLTHADIPWRFGNKSLSQFDLGDSFIQFDYIGFAAGFSNERIWTGPAIRNPLIFSNHAPGFLHGFVGTSEPYSIPWGDIEARWLWGVLNESDYFDGDPSNDRRFVSALSFNYSPFFIPGLSIGFTRAGYSYYNGLGISDLLLALKMSQPSHIADPEKAYFTMGALSARWIFPSVNFEVYAEWGRNDYRRRFRDFIAEPELNRGYVFGFLKNFEIASLKRILLNIEFTDLENASVTATNRDFNIWYENPVISQGFTNEGQVLGAGIGPGSSTQQVHLHYYNKWGMVGVSASRIAHQMDRHFKYKEYFKSELARYPQFYLLAGRHEIEMRYEFNLLLFLPYNFELQAGYKIGKVENRYNLRGVDVDNYQYSFILRYNLGGFNR